MTSAHHAAAVIGGFFGTQIALELCSVNTAAVHLKYELPLYIAALYYPKTINKLDLAIAVAADIGMN
jgi:hypothetical protein